MCVCVCVCAGGAYIAGGITPILLPRLQNNLSEGNSLLEGFLNPKAKEDFHEILKTIPLSVITNDKVRSYCLHVCLCVLARVRTGPCCLHVCIRLCVLTEV